MIHLHANSAYTLLNSTLTISDLVNINKEMGFKSVCLSDVNVMYGAMEFRKACLKADIKPIYGLVCSVMYMQEVVNFELLAKNDNGYKNLMKASTIISANKYLTIEEFIKLKEDCVLIVFNDEGVLQKALIDEDEAMLNSLLLKLKEDLKEFYVGLSFNESLFYAQRNSLLKRICNNLKIKTVALNKIYYAKAEDDYCHKVICAIKQQKTINDVSLSLIKSRYIKSEMEMSKIYEMDDLYNTDIIGDMCNVKMDIKTSLPLYKNNNQVSSFEYLKQLCLFGLNRRLNNKLNDNYVNRLKYELSVISKMHFEDYFLIVYDFILYAKKKHIYVGPGRGSAAGSLVSYCLGITDIDPIKYDLLFERFLNPDRISMPDIDTDFPDNKREMIIDYVYDRYGSNHVCNIVTFGTLKARQVIRDVAKVLNMPSYRIDSIVKMIPNMPKMTLKKALADNGNLKKLYDEDKQVKKIFDVAFRLEGLPRHTSMHAAGICLSKEDLNEVVPLIITNDNRTICQYTMEYLEEIGLIKMDFLGLRNLSIIEEVVELIHDVDLTFDIMKIDLNDEKTYKLLRQVDTIGVFQLESDGIRNLLRKMQPVRFEDIVATIALFRPGPMENIDIYLKNKNDPYNIQYQTAALEPILKDTYGIIIYQEQIMQIAKVMADFSLAKADILRKAMAKKQENSLIELRNDFINGCINKGYDKQLAIDIYDMILRFANYGFNKSHSVAYGYVAYQMAYLKANYPSQFYVALLNGVLDSDSKMAEYIDECRKKGIKILYPDINHSCTRFTLEKEGIRFPLSAIKNISSNVANVIKDEYEKDAFSDFYDFVARMSIHKITKKSIEALIDAGALDSFNKTRKTLLNAIDDAFSYSDLIKIETYGQITIDLNLVSRPVMLNIQENKFEKIKREKDALGFNLQDDPIIEIKQQLKINVEPLVRLKERYIIEKAFARIVKVKQHRTKNGYLMAFVVVQDETSTLDLVVMPNLYEKCMNYLSASNYIYFSGKIEKEGSCLVNTISNEKVDL